MSATERGNRLYNSEDEQVSRSLASKTGLTVIVNRWSSGDSNFVVLEPQDFADSSSWKVQIVVKPTKLEAEFVPASEAKSLAYRMSQSAPSAKARFAGLAAASLDQGAAIRFEVDGKKLAPDEPASWPTSWAKFVLRLDVPGEFGGSNKAQIIDWSEQFLSMILALMPADVTDDKTANPDGLPEGAVTRVNVNRYERSPVNRANCIVARGDSCEACGFNFGIVYGPIGAGFIHIHHVVPVSKIGPNYIVDPVEDLRPLCPNCHAIAHRANPPLSINQIKELLASAPSAGGDGSSTAGN